MSNLFFAPLVSEPETKTEVHKIRTHYRPATNTTGAEVLVTDQTTGRQESYAVDYAAQDIHAQASHRFVRGLQGTLRFMGVHASGDLYEFEEEVL